MVETRKPTASDKTVGAADGSAPSTKKAKVDAAAEAGGNTSRGVTSRGGCAGGLNWVLGAETCVDDFRQKHFEKKPLHVKRPQAQAAKYYEEFSDLSSPEDLFNLMEKGVVPVYRINMYRCIDGSTKEEADPPPSSVADARRLFSEGWSIQWLQPQQEHDVLAKFVGVLESQFGSLVGVNAYLTPPGVQGLAPHYDDVEVFVLQIGGRKSWNLHKSTSASPLPPETQTLPRYSSGDLQLESLAPAMMKPMLEVGDLLYMPRGTIHYAPNQDKKEASVHLTISTMQQQTVYDLISKTFEEAMAELWETDESLRRSLPWQALSAGSPEYPKMCTAVAESMRRVADAIDEEAKTSAEGEYAEGGGGCVAGALSELSAEFVKHRMPPTISSTEVVSCSMVTPASHVEVIDTSALSLVPLPGDDEGSVSLRHCIGNSRRNHMMTHPQSDPTGGSDGEEGEEEENEKGAEEDEESAQEGESDGGSAGDSEGLQLDPHLAMAFRELCASCAGSSKPLAAGIASNSGCGEGLASVLLRAKVPESSWSDVCSLLTQLSAIGLVRVGTLGSKAASSSKKPEITHKPKHKRKQGQ